MPSLTGYLYSQDESSEKFIGEWAEARGIRDQLFIATKVGPQYKCRPSTKKVDILSSVQYQFQGSWSIGLAKSTLRWE